ncbi:MAG TPA: N-acetylmuramoyl-L-alanine amidase [Candidatus Thiothrix moscowensis]|uniref:N-acetylmuramoyl-L-alanine amidase n=1 Tax=unclassified Thiothrix TaxID=2636184 RepID=UPI0025D7E1C6|nr:MULTISPECIES: N-acetylmuramoyl-L-alanine amidase [unclassified Thiothrix]HRJ52653.1 N-acetylmuramoyl-L-alanine amidase [Candidatus Thiothrix moscowensis]HRJ92863.1 N-acetylmuramoyl-L-alanine amidase [Candidatus Thiothrix moscowensis]
MNSNKASRRDFLLKLGTLAASVAGGWGAPAAFAASSQGRVTGASLEGSSTNLTFSLSLDQAVPYKTFTLENPHRVVIDLLNTRLAGKLKNGAHDRPPVIGIRYAEREDGSLRVVLDVSEPVGVSADMKGSSLVVSLKSSGRSSPAEKTQEAKKTTASKKKSQEKPVTEEPVRGKFIVVIDPGHGGKDPGAIGPNGTQEKEVVLQIARRLKKQIDQSKGMKAVLTRDSDRFIPLRDRMDIAHAHKANLFISIHADANNNARVNGSSVYILSENGASSEAAHLLAESENSYDLKFGGQSLSDTRSHIASVLLDLSQNAMIERSLYVAKGVLGELAKVNNPLRNRVESARFVVLRSPDIPSMLVETAFISNPTEERRLRTAEYQQQLADAMFRGVKRYQVAWAADQNARA